jgi:hypothetical protein
MGSTFNLTNVEVTSEIEIIAMLLTSVILSWDVRRLGDVRWQDFRSELHED